jgi:hypothetical protein
MKTRILAVWMTICCAAALLAGCGDAQAADAGEVADELKTSLVFQDDMMEIEKDVLENYYRVTDEEIEDFKVYKSASGATAEEIAVFTAKSGKTEAVKNAVEMRVEDLGLSFEDYVPEEMVKINNAVIVTRGSTVALVVADDSDGAKSLLDDLLK